MCPMLLQTLSPIPFPSVGLWSQSCHQLTCENCDLKRWRLVLFRQTRCSVSAELDGEMVSYLLPSAAVESSKPQWDGECVNKAQMMQLSWHWHRQEFLRDQIQGRNVFFFLFCSPPLGKLASLSRPSPALSVSLAEGKLSRLGRPKSSCWRKPFKEAFFNSLCVCACVCEGTRAFWEAVCSCECVCGGLVQCSNKRRLI